MSTFFSPAPLLHLNQCANLTVTSVQTELVPVCNKEHSMVGQSIHIWPIMCETQPKYISFVPLFSECLRCEALSLMVPWEFYVYLYPFAGTSTPPGISATAVPSIAAPLGVNGFSALPPQSNGQPTSEPIYTNGIHPYPGEPIKVCIKCEKEIRYIYSHETVADLSTYN